MVKSCIRCLYNENTPGITFDDSGYCSYCKIHDNLEKEYPTGKKGWKILKELSKTIKKSARGKKYDCVIGVSGGCDSSYLVYIAKQLGLRPIAVHWDNTWNSTIAVENIHNVLRKYNINLYTYVVDNKEFNDICRSFLSASVTDADIPNDIALATVLYMAAEKFGVKYILNGHSFRTEGIVPIGWTYMDAKYIQSVQKKFGSLKLKTFPNLWLLRWLKWINFNRIKQIRPLYYVNYVKEDAKTFLTEKFGWRWYGGHHFENKYTRFQKNYYLVKKFGIDKRYVEFSALLRSGQLKRSDALAELRSLPSFSEDELAEVKTRLGLSSEQLENTLKARKKSYKNYKTYHKTFKALRPLFWVMYKLNTIPKSFYIKYTK